MPLVALDTATDRILDLTCVDEPLWASVWRRRTGERLRCRGCGQPLHAKMRAATGSRWFAHTAAIPECPHVGETERHINLKREFAEAFRAVGWTATPEVAGDGYRADVLVTSPAGERVAVEIQVSPITVDDVSERTRRHSRAGLSTLWIAVDRRPDWTRGHPTVFVDDSNRVLDTVVVPSRERQHSKLAVAASASIGRFVERFAEGRITAVDDPDGLLAELLPPWSGAGFQLDSCSEWLMKDARDERERRRARDAERAAEAAARAAAWHAAREAEAAARAAAAPAMRSSLTAFVEWFASTRLCCWFRTAAFDTPGEALESDWDASYGIVILVGYLRPTHVLAVAEPRPIGDRHDQRVFAWTNGADPLTDTSGYPATLSPASSVDELPFLRELKPFRRKRRRW